MYRVFLSNELPPLVDAGSGMWPVDCDRCRGKLPSPFLVVRFAAGDRAACSEGCAIGLVRRQAA